MNRIQFARRSLELTLEQWHKLEDMAHALGTTAPTGPKAGQTSWRSLIKAIADGEIILTSKESHESDIAI